MRGKRSWVASTLAVTTLLFFALLGGIALLQKQLPRRREAAALSALESGDTELARSRAGKVEDEELRLQILSGCDYRDALRYMEEGKLQEAAESFEAAGEYEDAEELALGCRVRIAEALRGEGLWEEAIGKYAGNTPSSRRCGIPRRRSPPAATPGRSSFFPPEIGPAPPRCSGRPATIRTVRRAFWRWPSRSRATTIRKRPWQRSAARARRIWRV